MPSDPPPYRQPGRPVVERVADLLGGMTLEEKVHQLHPCGAQSIVLLKNNGALPLAAAVNSIALIGPLADDPAAPGGVVVLTADRQSTRFEVRL